MFHTKHLDVSHKTPRCLPKDVKAFFTPIHHLHLPAAVWSLFHPPCTVYFAFHLYKIKNIFHGVRQFFLIFAQITNLVKESTNETK